MKWKTWKCGLVLLLAAALAFPILQVRAEEEYSTSVELENSGSEMVVGVEGNNGSVMDVSVSGSDPAGRQVVDGMTALSVSSLTDPDAETEVRDGVIYSTRKVMLDSYHNNTYEILLTNTGTEIMENLSLELVSDTVELNGTPEELGDLPGTADPAGSQTTGDLQELSVVTERSENQIKVILTAKEGVAAGTDISGTLTVKSADRILAVLTLTGMAGDPSITTLEIPETVLYVPYGIKLQNSNTYDWNWVYYSLESGVLPAGVTVKPDGEIYGVPREEGEFTFTVRMDNYNNTGFTGFGSSSRTYTLVVKNNTDENVDMSTDEGYELSQRVQNIGIDALLSASSNSNVIPSQMLVSQGVYDEFVDVYLDGVKLVEGRDYQSESGSTRITIRSSTLISFGVGTHTLGVEFRTGMENILKRAAQNFQVSEIVREPDAVQEDDDDSVGQVAEIVAEKIYYTVVKGDSLSRIARYVGISLAQILAWNPQVKNPDLIFPGQVLLVGFTQGSAASAALNPGDGVYDEVKKGDCLYKIAGRNNITLKTIMEMNPEIAKQKYIYPGQKVRIK